MHYHQQFVLYLIKSIVLSIAYLSAFSFLTLVSIYIAASIGGFVAFSTTLLIAFLYIPSYIITTLKYRSGVIPSLKDDNFPDFRQAADNVTILLGSAFWGLLATGAFFFFLVVIPVMLIADPSTRQRSLTFLTRIAGTYFARPLLEVLFL